MEWNGWWTWGGGMVDYSRETGNWSGGLVQLVLILQT